MDFISLAALDRPFPKFQRLPVDLTSTPLCLLPHDPVLSYWPTYSFPDLVLSLGLAIFSPSLEFELDKTNFMTRRCHEHNSDTTPLISINKHRRHRAPAWKRTEKQWDVCLCTLQRWSWVRRALTVGLPWGIVAATHSKIMANREVHSWCAFKNCTWILILGTVVKTR